MVCNGRVDENDLEIADARHFIVNFENLRTLIYRRNYLTYDYLVSGGEGLNTLARVSMERHGIIYSSKFDRLFGPGDIRALPYHTSSFVWCLQQNS